MTAEVQTRAEALRSIDVAGVRFRPTTLSRLSAAVRAIAENKSPTPLVIGYVNPHVVTTAATTPVVAQHLRRCDHVCVDGIGVSLVARMRGNEVERLPAHRAFDHLLATGALRGRTVVIGIGADRVAHAATSIASAGEDISMVSTVSGFADDEEIRRTITSAGPLDLIVIGAGSPRSEEIADLVTEMHGAAVIVHAGAGTLKVHAGDREHPPRLMSRFGLDWVHRFATEPFTRRRYLVGLPMFVRQVLRPPAMQQEFVR